MRRTLKNLKLHNLFLNHSFPDSPECFLMKEGLGQKLFLLALRCLKQFLKGLLSEVHFFCNNTKVGQKELHNSISLVNY